MSFDIFIQRFQNGHTETFPRAAFEEVFGPNFTRTGPQCGFVRVEYPDGGGADVYLDDEVAIDGLMFSHPGGDGLFSSMLQLAAQTGGVIFWPAPQPNAAVADARVLAHLPADFIKACGAPIVLDEGIALRNAIVGTTADRTD